MRTRSLISVVVVIASSVVWFSFLPITERPERPTTTQQSITTQQSDAAHLGQFGHQQLPRPSAPLVAESVLGSGSSSSSSMTNQRHHLPKRIARLKSTRINLQGSTPPNTAVTHSPDATLTQSETAAASSVSPQCQEWCRRDRSPWSQKCAFDTRKCSSCIECTSQLSCQDFHDLLVIDSDSKFARGMCKSAWRGTLNSSTPVVVKRPLTTEDDRKQIGGAGANAFDLLTRFRYNSRKETKFASELPTKIRSASRVVDPEHFVKIYGSCKLEATSAADADVAETMVVVESELIRYNQIAGLDWVRSEDRASTKPWCFQAALLLQVSVFPCFCLPRTVTSCVRALSHNSPPHTAHGLTKPH